ncbi:MAG TPA: helix-turn-helix transcriptional regulator, partial [Azonexus sp.]|nr:helix-turn-helix transcriptional regulator [Azonexus sp.]
FCTGDKMIRCHLSRMMGERKMKIVDVARETGLHRNTITLLYNETATRIDLETIDGLCELFNCKVGDLFEYSPSSNSSDKGHGEQ